MRARIAALALLEALALLAAAGCSSKKNVLKPNLEPETYLFVQGPVKTTNHRIHLYWYGTDPDGDVVAFDMRWIHSWELADTVRWRRLPCALPGRCTDSVFTIFTGDSAVVRPRFEIRAVDDRGAVDSKPAFQQFPLGNLAPTVRITNPLRLTDTTFASVTLSWEVNDPDGGGPGLRYRIWMDGNQANYDSTEATTFTVPSARFLEGGTWTTRTRTVFVQAVDDGGRSGPPDSTSWFVRAPAAALDPVTKRGRLLVIDDSRSTAQNNFTVDTLYANTFARNQALTGRYTIQRLEFSDPLRSAADLAQTFRQFDAVAWYRGYETNISIPLQTYEDSLRAFVRGGGRLFLEGLYLFNGQNTFGSLREDFVSDLLNCRRLFLQWDSGVNDSTAGLGTVSTATLRTSTYTVTGYPQSRIRLTVLPQLQGQPPGLRGFVANDTSQVALWAMPGTFTDAGVTFDVAVAMSVDRAPSGRLIVVPFPVRACSPAVPFVPSFQVLKRLLFDSPRGLLAP